MPPRSYSSGHFLFELENEEPGFIKSVEGGSLKASVVEEQIGTAMIRYKHVSTVEIEPIGLEVGMSMTRPMFEWIRSSWNQDFYRKNGAIYHLDSDYRTRLEQSFLDALIVETTFPALDASDKNPAYLKVKLHPESLELHRGDGRPRQAAYAPKQKLWSPSNFRVAIDGCDCTHVSKVDSLSVKQKVKQLYMGSRRHPELEPTGIEFSNLTLYMAVDHAGDFLDWHQKTLVNGARDTDEERTGHIEFYDPSLKQVLLTLQLYGLGMYSLSLDKGEANADQIKRCKVELYCERMDLVFGGGFA